MTTQTRTNPNVAPSSSAEHSTLRATGRLAAPSPRTRGRGGGRLGGRRVPGRRRARRRTRRARHRERAHRGGPVRLRDRLGAPGRALHAVHRAATALGRGARPGARARAASPCWPWGPRRTPPSTGSGRRSCSHSHSGWAFGSIATWTAGRPAGCSTPPSAPWVSPPSAAPTRPSAPPPTRRASRCRAGWSTSAATACT